MAEKQESILDAEMDEGFVLLGEEEPVVKKTRGRTPKRSSRWTNYLQENVDSLILCICNIRSAAIREDLMTLLMSLIGTHVTKLSILHGWTFGFVSVCPEKQMKMKEMLRSFKNYNLIVFGVHDIPQQGHFYLLPTTQVGEPEQPSPTLIMRDVPKTITKAALLKELNSFECINILSVTFFLQKGAFDGIVALNFASTEEAAHAHKLINTLYIFEKHSMVRAEYERSMASRQRPVEPPAATSAIQSKLLADLRDLVTSSRISSKVINTAKMDAPTRDFIVMHCNKLGLTCVSDGDHPTHQLTITRPAGLRSLASLEVSPFDSQRSTESGMGSLSSRAESLTSHAAAGPYVPPQLRGLGPLGPRHATAPAGSAAAAAAAAVKHSSAGAGRPAAAASAPLGEEDEGRGSAEAARTGATATPPPSRDSSTIIVTDRRSNAKPVSRTR
eukprot:m.206607 g.206607  ORF g.206607 m.206607 type:complete len:444 (-) comp15536_c28_seq2:26-1357(-)